MTLVEEVYAATRQFPVDERFGLTSQLRRAAVSIPSNIAEGARRKRRKSNLHHLEIALGSQGEVDTQLEIALRLGFFDRDMHRRLGARTEAVGKMLNGLITSLQLDDENETTND